MNLCLTFMLPYLPHHNGLQPHDLYIEINPFFHKLSFVMHFIIAMTKIIKFWAHSLKDFGGAEQLTK